MGVGLAMAGVSLAQTGMSMYSTNKAAKEEAKGIREQSEYQAVLTEQEAEGLEIDKEQLWSQYLVDKRNVTKIQKADIGRTRADTGAKGVQLDMGLLSDINTEYERDKSLMFENLKLKADALTREQGQLRSKAGHVRSEGRRSSKSVEKMGKRSAITQGITGGMRAGFGMYSAYKNRPPSNRLTKTYKGASGTDEKYINKKYGGYFNG